MKVCISALAIALGATFLASSAEAAMVVFDDFDGYADQAAFAAAWPALGSATSGTLSSAESVSPPNSINYVATAVGAEAQRNGRTFAATTPTAANPLVFSFDYFDSNAAASPYRQYSNLQAPIGPTASLISMGLNNNLSSAAEGGNFYMARVLGVNGGAYFKLNEGGDDTLRSTGWHNLAVRISDTELNFFVDNILAKTVANTSLQGYTSIALGSGLSNAENSANFDNVRLESVPEPTSLALVALGCAAMFGLARRRDVA